MKSDARVSTDGKFRYSLTRIWDDKLPLVTFIGLNPSTADATQDDPTIRKSIAYAKRWGTGGVYVANLFPFRDTHQTQIWNEPDPIGPENNKWLANLASKASFVVAAWGNEGWRLDRSAAVCRLLPRLHALKLNKSGEPHHPLYLSPAIRPQPYNRKGIHV